MATLLGAIKLKKSWKQVIQPYLNKYDRDTKKIFTDFEKEKKSKGLSSTAEINKLWREKYKSKLDKIEAKYDAEYKKIWNKYHNK